jgi:hypothetical protein
MAFIVGAAGFVLVWMNWSYIVTVAKVGGAAGGATAAAGVAVVGLLLIYAGLPKRATASH